MSATFKSGDRVRLNYDVERYPHFIAPKGAAGTILPIHDGDSVLLVRLDEPVFGMEEWDNELQVMLDGSDDDPAEMLSHLAGQPA